MIVNDGDGNDQDFGTLVEIIVVFNDHNRNA
jgi:hypothetical protein